MIIPSEADKIAKWKVLKHKSADISISRVVQVIGGDAEGEVTTEFTVKVSPYNTRIAFAQSQHRVAVRRRPLPYAE